MSIGKIAGLFSLLLAISVAGCGGHSDHYTNTGQHKHFQDGNLKGYDASAKSAAYAKRPISLNTHGVRLELKSGVVMMDGSSQKALVLEGHSASKSKLNQIQVRATLSNVFAGKDLWADVRFVFYNAAGEPVDKSAWVNKHFPLTELTMVENNSLRNDVVSFNVQVRNVHTR